MLKWEYQQGPVTCECGERHEHLLLSVLALLKYNIYDLQLVNENAVSVATYWLKQNVLNSDVININIDPTTGHGKNTQVGHSMLN